MHPGISEILKEMHRKLLVHYKFTPSLFNQKKTILFVVQLNNDVQWDMSVPGVWKPTIKCMKGLETLQNSVGRWCIGSWGASRNTAQ